MDCHKEHSARTCRHCRRPSSYGMQDPELVFNELGLRPGRVFLDLGCGAGEYSLKAASIVGPRGRVYALDHKRDIVQSLIEDARSRGLHNIEAMEADVAAPLPLEDNAADVCLISTVLHIFTLSQVEKVIFSEMRRVLKPNGLLAVIECGKEDLSFGPPLEMRLTPEEIETAAARGGFVRSKMINLGFNYMLMLIPGGEDPG